MSCPCVLQLSLSWNTITFGMVNKKKPQCKILGFSIGVNTSYGTTQSAFCSEAHQQRSVQFVARLQFLSLGNVMTLNVNTQIPCRSTLITMNKWVCPLHVSLRGDGGIKRKSDLHQMHNRLNSVHLNLIGILSQREVFFCQLWWAI